MAAEFDPDHPLNGLVVGEHAEPNATRGLGACRGACRSSNQHDIWTLRGVGIKEEQLPMVLGCDAAGIDPDGNEVIVHAVLSSDDWRGDETLDPKRSLLSEIHDGTCAEYVVVPRRNLVPKPPSLSFEAAACLPDRLAHRVPDAVHQLGRRAGEHGARAGRGWWRRDRARSRSGAAAGHPVWVNEPRRGEAGVRGSSSARSTPRSKPGRGRLSASTRSMETVGAPTWSHSLRALRPGRRRRGRGCDRKAWSRPKTCAASSSSSSASSAGQRKRYESSSCGSHSCARTPGSSR